MHPVQAAKKAEKRLKAIEANQLKIIAMLEAMDTPVEMVELEPIEIPEEMVKMPAKKRKAKVQ